MSARTGADLERVLSTLGRSQSMISTTRDPPPPGYGDVSDTLVNLFPELFPDTPLPAHVPLDAEAGGEDAAEGTDAAGAKDEAEATPAEDGDAGAAPTPRDQYEERIAVIDETCETTVAHADEVEAYLLQATEEAKEAERYLLAQDDVEFTHKHRAIPRPTDPSLLVLDRSLVNEEGLQDPHTFLEMREDNQYERVAPPRTMEFADTSVKGWEKPTASTLSRQSAWLSEHPPLPKHSFKKMGGGEYTLEEFLERVKESEARAKELSVKMTDEQMDLEKEVLRRMALKLNFLRNPRFREKLERASLRAHLAPPPLGDAAPHPSDGAFAVEPSNVEFNDYEVGGVYEMSVDLRNISFISRRLRLLPPSTNYFSLSLARFPNEGGMVAPGMKCQVTVRFCPDSLADYDDSFYVVTEVSKFAVPIKARRPPPSLTLPATLDCANCIVGNTCVLKVPFENAGGTGKFRLVASQDWPNAVTEFCDGSRYGLTAGPAIAVGPFFHMAPAAFELRNKEECEMQISFSPNHNGDHMARVVMVCDNCQTRQFTLVGNGCYVELVVESLDGVPFVPERDAYEDADPNDDREDIQVEPKTLSFPGTVPQSVDRKVITIKNKTPLPLPFEWHQFVPQLGIRIPGQVPKGVLGLKKMKQQTMPRHVTEEEADIFDISPSYGVFEAKQTLSFTVTFAPKELIKCSRISRIFIDKSVDGSAHTCDFSVLSVPINGIARSHAVALSPGYIKMPGKLLLGKRYVREVRLTNDTSTPAPFHFILAEGEPGFVEMEPWSGVVEPHGAIEVLVNITPYAVGPARAVLTCDIEHGPSLPVLVEANVTGPSVIVEQAEVDIALVQVGSTMTKKFNLKNLTDVSAEFDLSVVAAPERGCSDYIASDLLERLVIEPGSGIVPPHSTIAVTAAYTAAMRQGKMRGTIICKVVGGPTQYVSTRADILAPRVAIDESVVDLNVSFVGVPVTRKMVLQNLTKLPAKFQWDPKTLGATKHLVDIEIVPNKGIIAPAGKRNLTVTFLPKEAGFADIIAACDVVGMAKPLGFRLKTEVKGLVIAYSIITADDYERYNTFAPKPVRGRSRSRSGTGSRNSSPPRTGGSVAFSEVSAQDEVTITDLTSAEEGRDAAAADLAEPKRVPMDGDLLINYGDDNIVEKHHEMYLVVHNESSIPTRVDVALERLAAPALQEEVMEEPDIATARLRTRGSGEKVLSRDGRLTTQSTAMLSSRTKMSSAYSMGSGMSTGASSNTRRLRKKPYLSSQHEVSMPYRSDMGKTMMATRKHQETDLELLQEEKGAAVVVEPHNGCMLDAWTSVVIKLTVVSSMPGCYDDNVVVTVGYLPPKVIPIRVGIVGTPLRIHKEANPRGGLPMPLVSTTRPDVLRDPMATRIHFGQVPQNTDSVTRLFRVSNTASYSMDVSWDVFNYLELDDEDLVEATITETLIEADGTIKAVVKAGAASIENDDVFNVEPRFATIAPYGHQVFAVSFCSDFTARLYGGYLLGHQKINTPIEHIEVRSMVHPEGRGPVLEPVEVFLRGGYTPHCNAPPTPLAPLRMELIADCIVPFLDPDDREMLHFHCFSPMPRTDPSYTRTVVFTNRGNLPISFVAFVTAPFELVDVEPSVDQPPGGEETMEDGVGNRRDIITLPPRENVALTLSFVPPEVESPDLKDYQLRGILTFNHRNGADQPFDVLADYWHPELYVEDVVGHATSVMDFGEVHVAAPRTLRLTLVNPTRVDAEWFVEQLEADYSPLGPKESAPSALPFVVSPAHGVIPGKARSIPHKVTVDVTLRTSEARRYLTKLRFRVRAGRGCAVACAGMGSFDETVEAGYNSQHGHVHGMLDNYTPNDDVAL
ncbi:flagellar associated protein [Pseudoscourfieldia marina]